MPELLGQEIDLRNSPLFTPLHTAVCHGNVATAELFLQRGARVTGCVNTRAHREETTVLHTAASNNDGETIKLLQKVRDVDWEDGWVDIDATDREGYTAMHMAVLHHGELHALEALDKRASFLLDTNANTAYGLAFMNGRFQACSALERFEPSVRDYGDGEGGEPLGESSALQRAVLPMETFFQPPDPPEFDRDAWERQRASYVDLLLKHPDVDCDVNGEDGWGKTPLIVATSNRWPSPVLIECLLENGADPNYVDIVMETPLHIVCGYDDLDVFKACAKPLLRYGARLDITYGRKLSALQTALNRVRIGPNGQDVIVDFHCVAAEFLLQHVKPANLNKKFIDDLLSIAHMRGAYVECRVLMRHGGELAFSKRAIQSMLKDSIEDKRLPKMLLYLDRLPEHVSARDALQLAFDLYLPGRWGSPLNDDGSKVVRMLLSRSDLEVGPRVPDEHSLLHLACIQVAPLQIVEKVLERGANVNLFDEYLRTPHSIAIEYGCPHTVELLLKHGANVHAKPPPGRWADYCQQLVRASRNRAPEKSLFASYPKPKMQGKDYRTPFQLAILVAEIGTVSLACHENHNSRLVVKSDIYLRMMLAAKQTNQSDIQVALVTPKALQCVLDQFANANGDGYGLDPPVMFVVRNVVDFPLCIELIGILLKAGANIQRKDREGRCFADVMREATRARAEEQNEDAEFDIFNGGPTEMFKLQCWLVRHFRYTLSPWYGERVEVIAETCAEKTVPEYERLKSGFLKRYNGNYWKDLWEELEAKEAAEEEKRAQWVAEHGPPRRSERLREKGESRREEP